MIKNDAFEALERVKDRRSFIEFVEVLSSERERAEKMERAAPESYRWSGALNWQNGDISTYLECALAGFIANEKLTQEPSWRTFAEFLYLGKIYE